MRNRTLAQILESVRLESGRSANVQLGVNEEPALKQRINRVYEYLWFDYNWPFLKIMDADKAVTAGTYKIDLPTNIDMERIEKVAVRFSNTWRPLDKGLTTEMYNALDSENDERSEPIENYDLQWTGTAPQVVLWPRPSVDTTVRFQGRKKFEKLVNSSDVCLLDDQIVYMFVAAELLAKAESPDANAVAQAAQRRYNTLKFGYDKNRNSKFSLAGSAGAEPSNRGKPEVRVAIAPVSS